MKYPSVTCSLAATCWSVSSFTSSPRSIFNKVFRSTRVFSDASTCCRSGGDAEWEEQRLLAKFWQYFTEFAPRVVTWNGKGFDLPVLRARAMMYGISAQSWYQRGTKWDNYMQRFAPDWHCDLMEQLSDYRACASMKLEDVALALGLPGKIGGHGSEVEPMVQRGEINNVRAYCEGDCLNLFVLYVRWALLSGRIDPAGHNSSLESLVRCLESQRNVRPHLGVFLDSWRATRRSTPMFIPIPATALASDAFGTTPNYA